jgi:hypothetical protein
MNTSNKLNKPKKKSVAKTVASPKSKSVAKSVASPKAKSVTSPKAKTVTSPKAKTVTKPVTSPKAKTVTKPASPKAKPVASKPKKALVPTPVLLNAPVPKPLQKAAKNEPNQHTRKRYVDIRVIIDKLKLNSNAANNFEDSYKIEGEGMTRAEYKRLKS